MSLTNSANWMYNPGGDFYGYEIDNSLRFDAAGNHYLNRTLNGNRKTFTVSFWYKRSGTAEQQIFTSGSTSAGFVIASDQLEVFNYNGGYQIRVRSQRKLRDVSSWYHIVVRIDTTQATASDRVRIYINGELETNFTYSTYPSQNYDTIYNNNTAHRIGQNIGGTQDVDGYLANFEFTDGVSNAPTEFGQSKSGVWIPKEYSGSYGTSGFHLEFAGNANDTSGNGNNWTTNNIGSHDYMPDSPTNNFAVLNPLYNSRSTSYPTPVLSQGNLAASTTSGSNWKTVPTTMYMSSGKWYAEVKVTYINYPDSFIGFASSEFNGQTYAPSETAFGYQFHHVLGIRHNSTQLSAQTFTQGDIIGLALDMDNNEIKFYKNGSLLYTATSVAAGSWSVALTLIYTKTLYANFGQDSTFAGTSAAGGNADENGIGDFAYAPPSGFLSLCSANLPDPAIDPLDDETPADYFGTAFWTGNGGTQSISGLGFEPDFVWLKGRSYAEHHQLYDTIRGATEVLYSNRTNAEQSDTLGLTSFDSDGFSIGSRHEINNSGDSFVGWTWKAGGSGVTNTSGSITSTVSANPDAGFSVVTYTGNGTAGATVGHGLGKAPSVLICKRLDLSDNWIVYHQGIASDAATDYLHLDLTNAAADNVGAWNDTAPSSTVFTLGSFYNANAPGGSIVAYCFADIPGYQKAGSYRGNGSTDGTFVYTGFRPAFVMVKGYTGGEHWNIPVFTSSTNGTVNTLSPNLSNAERTMNQNPAIDFVSNGFKIRTNDGNYNSSGGGYIYLAIAEQPFKYANAR